jgi:hypothetical protein
MRGKVLSPVLEKHVVIHSTDSIACSQHVHTVGRRFGVVAAGLMLCSPGFAIDAMAMTITRYHYARHIIMMFNDDRAVGEGSLPQNAPFINFFLVMGRLEARPPSTDRRPRKPLMIIWMLGRTYIHTRYHTWK